MTGTRRRPLRRRLKSALLRFWDAYAGHIGIAIFVLVIGALIAIPAVLLLVFTDLPGWVVVGAGGVAVVAVVAVCAQGLKSMRLPM